MRIKSLYSYLGVTLILVLILSLTGCPKKPPVIIPELDADYEEPLRKFGPDFESIPELATVHFKFDKFNLTDEARNKLQDNTDFLKKYSDPEVIVEGHCCECGTNEYNLALGQKRAKVVRDYYIKLGVPSNTISTISYGEEKPINVNAGPPDSPLCNVNRRAETKVRMKAAE